MLAELLSGRSATSAQLQIHPFTEYGKLETGSQSASLKRKQCHFHEDVRRYNGAMGFAAFCDHLTSPSKSLCREGASNRCDRGPPVYILHGRAYHSVGTLYPPEGSQPKYAQLYVFDPVEASQKRASNFDGLRSNVLRDFHSMLVEPVVDIDMWTGEAKNNEWHPRNPHPAHFESMHQVTSQSQHPSVLHALRFAGGKDKDPRTYNKPSSAEVSCIIVGMNLTYFSV